MEKTKSQKVRETLSHPVVDSDGHTVECEVAFLEYLREVGGAKMVDRYRDNDVLGSFVDQRGDGWYRLSPEDRAYRRVTRRPWWGLPAKNTLDRATASLPKLLHERLPETGVDYAVLYTSLGLSFPNIPDDEMRQACCRALNKYNHDIFKEYSDRLTPTAVIPMNTPQEAIAELEHAIGELGMKAIMMASHARRQIPIVAEKFPDAARYTSWIDNFIIDSPYDYDPVWAKCGELKVCPTYHSGTMGVGTRATVTNYMYNHIGHFAQAGEGLAKALFMGGVTRRFPTLKFAFLEGGVAWGCNLYADLIGHWEKRNGNRIDTYNPANIDRQLYVDLFKKYGGSKLGNDSVISRLMDDSMLYKNLEDSSTLRDEWAPAKIEKLEDFRELFVKPFYFGCEADDPTNAWAFDAKRNPLHAKLKPVFSSDIGHWDVPDITEVTEEAHELVEHGLITEEDFREFVFVNPVHLWTDMNPDFFKGTVVESEVNQLMASNPHR
jgi:predicted TIM-barrel fold metal-dependent hydrolase